MKTNLPSREDERLAFQQEQHGGGADRASQAFSRAAMAPLMDNSGRSDMISSLLVPQRNDYQQWYAGGAAAAAGNTNPGGRSTSEDAVAGFPLEDVSNHHHILPVDDSRSSSSSSSNSHNQHSLQEESQPSSLPNFINTTAGKDLLYQILLKAKAQGPTESLKKGTREPYFRANIDSWYNNGPAAAEGGGFLQG